MAAASFQCKILGEPVAIGIGRQVLQLKDGAYAVACRESGKWLSCAADGISHIPGRDARGGVRRNGGYRADPRTATVT